MNDKFVLFVDDEEKVLKAWSRAFRQESYTMLYANSAEEALKIMQNYIVSVIVSDYSMPGRDGIELLLEVKDLYPATTRIMVSGQATLDVASEAINVCGIYKLFQKPCSKLELELAIRDGIALFSTQNDISSLSDLERQHPGITRVQRNSKGAILI